VPAQPKPKPEISAKEAFQRVRKAEAQLFRRLRKIANHIGDMVSNFPNAGPDDLQSETIANLLDRYGEILEPWAEIEARKITAEVAQRDERAWFKVAKKMSRAIRHEIQSTPVGHVLQARSQESALLIKSLPTEAAARIRKLTLEARASGKRPAELIEEIQRSGDVSIGRARLIARTEVARTASMLTEARAQSLGSTHYIWRTVKDRAVRSAHAEMEGVICEWAKPPTLSDGTTTHAGQIYNCRCFPEPIFDFDK